MQNKELTQKMDLLKQQMHDYLSVDNMKANMKDPAATVSSKGAFNDNVDLIELESMQKKLSKQEKDINVLSQIGKNLEVL